jgi:putative ABC transport system substrate-binding protein
MQRRQFIALIGPLIVGTAIAQAQKRTPREIGLLSSRSAGESASLIAAFHDGLKESGYVEGIGPKRRSRDVCYSVAVRG